MKSPYPTIQFVAHALCVGGLFVGLARPLCAEEKVSSTPPATRSIKGDEPAHLDGTTWETIRRETIFQLIPTVGTFQAHQKTKLGSQVAGRVETVLVDVGDVVKKGQELIRLEKNFFEIELAQRRAELESSQITVAELAVKRDRARELWGTGENAPVSRQFVDDAEAAFNVAQSRINQSQQAIRYSEERLKETTIRAPYDGVITQRLVDVGEPVEAMFITSLLEVQELTTLELIFSLPQESLSRVKTGMPVLFRIEGLPGFIGQAKLDTIYPTLDEATRSARCRAFVQNSDLKLRPSLLAEVGVVEREIPNALSVPRRALTQTSSGWRVTVLENGKAVSREVKIGVISILDNAEVMEGLKEGDRVLVMKPDAQGS